ncbi:hypothetical protein A2U01_0084676, partial [Trifolium medium]|nr:hypothetical protein [Trifolium medium]
MRVAQHHPARRARTRNQTALSSSKLRVAPSTHACRAGTRRKQENRTNPARCVALLRALRQD